MEVDDGGSETMDVQTEEIPQEVWNIILPCGNYLKKIMEFCGYTRKESIVKLKEKDEMDKMFTFVKSMSEVIEDKHAVFGVFSVLWVRQHLPIPFQLFEKNHLLCFEDHINPMSNVSVWSL